MNANGFVDLRSDTVTTPTADMRRAMADAEVGDDCYGEDPTVNRLQELAAGMLGCEAALYVPTGTMANQVCVKVLASPGGEVVCEQDCHLVHHESGACALLSQVQLRGVTGHRGVLDGSEVEAALRPDDPFQPRTVLVAVENTHNAAGGTVWPLEAVEEVGRVAAAAGLPYFCDGARLFNACVASGTEAKRFAAPCDLVTISLYKGLAAPMGSLICGPRDLMHEAWRFRRIFGGALRQAGVMAAAGILSLERMVDRLADDHELAARLGEGLAGLTDGKVPEPETNMVILDVGALGLEVDAFLYELRSEGVLAGPMGPGTVRFVTHKDVDRSGVERAVEATARVLQAMRPMGVTR